MYCYILFSYLFCLSFKKSNSFYIYSREIVMELFVSISVKVDKKTVLICCGNFLIYFFKNLSNFKKLVFSWLSANTNNNSYCELVSNISMIKYNLHCFLQILLSIISCFKLCDCYVLFLKSKNLSR
jgi:hypothetical protein